MKRRKIYKLTQPFEFFSNKFIYVSLLFVYF